MADDGSLCGDHFLGSFPPRWVDEHRVSVLAFGTSLVLARGQVEAALDDASTERAW